MVVAMLSHAALVLLPLLVWEHGQTGQGYHTAENKSSVLHPQLGFFTE